MTDCTDCKHLEYDCTDDDDYVSCQKDIELLISLEIPDGCTYFEKAWEKP